MAMTSLNINYQNTRDTGTAIQNYASDFKKLLSEIQSLNDSLKNSWTGGDATKYTSEIEEQAQVMNKLQTTLDEVGSYLIQVGDAYQKAMEENTLN